MATEFDKYVNDYKDIINRVSGASGERYEFFIELRTGLMKSRLKATTLDLAHLKILDVGCGIGVTEYFIQCNFPDAEITGVDNSEESIAAANSLHLRNSRFVVSSSTNLPFEDGWFDLIYSNGTMHHIPHEQHPGVLGEMYRVLKPGGSIFLFENNPFNPLMMRAMRQNPFDADAKVVYPGRLAETAKAARFGINGVYYYFFYPHMLQFLRWTEKYLSWLPLGAQYFLWGYKPKG